MIYDMFHENDLKLNKHDLFMMLNIKIMSKYVLKLVIGDFRVRVGAENLEVCIIVCIAW